MNWEREFKKWCPALKVVVYHGSQQERLEKQYELKSGKFNVIVTTHNMVTLKNDRGFFRKFNFCYLVLGKKKFNFKIEIFFVLTLETKMRHRKPRTLLLFFTNIF